MKKNFYVLLAAAFLALPLAAAEETRTIRLIQDDGQEQMATKIYNLKHLKASDVGMYVDAAVRRYKSTSKVRCLNFAANKQQSLIVTTPEKFIPYVDQLVAVLDRGSKRDGNGSVVKVSYKWKVYYPRFRAADDLTLPADVMLSCTGRVYSQNGTIWIKDDMDDVDYALDWIKYFDRPVPQANLTLRYYVVRESTLRDIGLDYLAWKNGPGMNLLDVAYNSGRIAWDKVLGEAVNLGSSFSWGYGGVFTAPAFDMSFIRMLQQSGDAKIVATANLNVVNAQSKATLSLSPAYNAITKDPDTHASAVEAQQITDFLVSFYDPCICFFTEPKEITELGWIPSDKAFYAKNRGSLIFSFDIKSSDPVEANNYGSLIAASGAVRSSCKTVHFGQEQLLVKMSRSYDVEQTTGIPFLCQLPVLKYIFGTTTTMKETNHIFVTVEANLVYPETKPVETPAAPEAAAKKSSKARPEAKAKAKSSEARPEAKAEAKPSTEAAKK